MSISWETDLLYRRVLRAGGVWNLAASVPTLILVPYLPALLNIDDPHYPIFIYFNLMTVGLFGFIHFFVAKHLSLMRGMMKILMWSKVFTAGIFAAVVSIGPIPDSLAGFLAPAMAIDLAFGIVYLRYIFYSRRATVSDLTVGQIVSPTLSE